MLTLLLLIITLACLHLAHVTLKAGLPLFAVGIAASSLLGCSLIFIGVHVLGWPLLMLSMLLVVLSHGQMKRYGIGPFKK